MYMETSQIQASLVNAAKGKFDLRASKLPAFGTQTPRPVNSGSALLILAKDPARQRAAWEFVKFVTSARRYTIITSKIGYVPLRPAIVNDPQYLKPYADANPLILPNLAQLDSLEQWVSFAGPNYQQITKTMLQAIQQAMYGTDDNIRKIMSDAQTQAQSLMPQN